MNNIEFRLMRESLHLSQTDLSEFWELNIRTIQSWEQGRNKIPQKRIDELVEIDKHIYFAAEQFERKIVESRKGFDVPDTIVLIAYKKENYDGDLKHYRLHNCLLSQCVKRLNIIDIKSKIILFNSKEYFEWLDSEHDAEN